MTAQKTEKKKVLVNVASSVFALEDYINLENHIFLSMMWIYRWFRGLIPAKYHDMFNDFQKAKQKAYIQKHDCRKPLPFENKSVDHILCSHFLEHVFPDEADKILKDYERVLCTSLFQISNIK